MTASRRLARFASGQGANTAGIGVCFQSRTRWLETFRESGSEVLATGDGVPWDVPLKWRLFLHVGRLRCGHFWARPAMADASSATTSSAARTAAAA
jgi:hypothetical protein